MTMNVIKGAGVDVFDKMGFKPREKWPFVKMDVGDMVKIDGDDSMLRRAQSVAIMAGKNKKWKIETRKKDGSLYVLRIS